ncbi:MAG: hypothetical protein WD801_02060 [Gemmatimonadaceae bacterium]
MTRAISFIVLASAIVAGAAVSQDAPIRSMGQPPRWEPYAMPSALRAAPGDWQPALAAGVHRPLKNPVTGLFGVAGEAYVAGVRDARPGARLLATSRALGLAAGVDWNGRDAVDAVLSFQTAIRRGGLLGSGTMLRLDWVPARRDALSIGVHVPLGQPWLGRTRRADVDVGEPAAASRRPLFVGAEPPEANVALDAVERASAMILAYTNLFAEDTARIRYGESFAAAMLTYERGLDEAFGAAAGNLVLAKGITHRARLGLLHDVLLPYDSLFGQVKEHASSIRSLTSSAHTRFSDWLRDSTTLGGDARVAVASVHARWLRIVERVHANLLAQWKDSRLVWLPLQLALRTDEYDEQSEVDALIEHAVGRPFTDRNALTYLRSSDLPLEVARSLYAARDYHVLWTHDFTGQRDDTRALDEVGYTMVVDAYLPALTAAVQRHDSVGRLPAYMILLDQYYYAQRNGRLWMTILENPLSADMKLPGDNAQREARLRERQAELRAAVAASRVDPRDVRVHVNILNRADFSFRSHRIVPTWPFVPDAVMRDHRKVMFYDVTESDPYRGAMMLMGVGIGEHYASATWEDRGYRIRGPAALEVRDAARRALITNGMAPDDIPAPLRVPTADGNGEGEDPDYVGRALHLHNESGFGAKESSVARAMMYNLAPPGSVIIVPDALWLSETWAAMLAGAAARGARVYVIAPSKANSPNQQAPVIARIHVVMQRLLQVRERLAEQFARTGGELRVGLYASATEVTDVAGRVAEVREGLRRAPWIRELIPFDDATLAVMDRALVQTEADGRGASDIATDQTPRMPKLHSKAQMVARPGAIQALVRRPGWENVLLRTMQAQSRRSSTFADQMSWTTPDVDSSALRDADEVLRGYEEAIPEAERKRFSFYFSVGTQNQDPRGIMLDGEATLLVSGPQASAGLVDLYYTMARSTWIESDVELERLLPMPGWMMRWVARIVKLAL